MLFKELKHSYSVFDRDGDGNITIRELGLVLRNLGLFPTEQELDQMLKDIDIDGKVTHIGFQADFNTKNLSFFEL